MRPRRSRPRCTPAASRAGEAGQVRHERGVADAGAPRDAGEDLGGVGHLRHPLRADTNAETSMTACPAADSAIDERDLGRRSAPTPASFCRPSRGPTSTIVTLARAAAQSAHSRSDQRHTGLHELALRGSAPPSTTPSRGAPNRQLHLHRFEHQHGLALGDRLSRRSTSSFATVAGIGAIIASARVGSLARAAATGRSRRRTRATWPSTEHPARVPGVGDRHLPPALCRRSTTYRPGPASVTVIRCVVDARPDRRRPAGR